MKPYSVFLFLSLSEPGIFIYGISWSKSRGDLGSLDHWVKRTCSAPYPLTLREEHRLRVFENKVPYLGRYLGLREMKLQENGESYIMLSYMHCILRLT